MNPPSPLLILCAVAMGCGARFAQTQNYEDRFEPNNDQGRATPLTAFDGLVDERLLTVYPTGDRDYYRFTLPTAGQSGHYIEVYSVMSHPLLGVGRVDFALANSAGSGLATASTPVGTGSARISLEGRAAGTYLLGVEGRIGSYGWYNLEIRVPTATPPTITSHPQSQTVTAGANVTFNVVATGTDPLSYQWRKDEQDLAGQTGASLTLNDVQASHAGNYTVVVSNSAGNATSNPATLTLNPAGTPAGIAERVLPAGYVAGAAFAVTLEIEAGAQAVAWGAEDQPPEGWTVSNISHGGLFDSQNRKVKWDPFFINQPADRVRTLTYEVTPPAGATGEATFDGVASFDGMNVPITGHRTIAPGVSAGGSPTIVTHPATQSAPTGASVSFSVTATGDPPLTYQWRFNRVAIPGATSQTLTLNPVQASHAGSYTVVVSNAHGSATSQPAILTVVGATGDAPRFDHVQFVPGEGFRFRLTGPVGRRYALEASTDLQAWIEIATLDNPTGTIEFTDAEAVVFPQSYYRVRQVTP